jgi:hypothetical protein
LPLAVVALIGSAMAMTPAALPSIDTKMAVAPSRLSSSALRSRLPVSTPLRHDPAIADDQLSSGNDTGHAFADRRIEGLHDRQG